jgi:molybdenum cofactor synthesis domain-containing protein
VLTPREIGLLAALGVEAVPVRGQPRVGIVSTGEELVRPGGDPDPGAGQIFDVNSYSVATGVEDAGGEAVLYPHAGDDYEAMERRLREAARECDLVLSSGSTSASAVDVVYRVVEDVGELLLHGASVKPGKPTIVGRLGEAAYIGLPGYPVSALTIFRTFVAPAIREAAGLPEAATATTVGWMAVRERYTEGRTRLVPVGLVEAGADERLEAGDDDGEGGIDVGGGTLVYPVDRGSGATTSLANADGVVTQPADMAYLAAGERVEVELFAPDVRPPALVAAGEDDPALARLLDRIDRPRYLSEGSRPGLRRLRDGVTDAAVVAGPPEGGADGYPRLGGWTREWGLIVPADNPEGVSGLPDLVDRDLAFVNRTTASGLRGSLGAAIAALADDRGVDRHALVDRIDGFERATRAHESPARRVREGDADAGLGLRASADRLDTGFVPVDAEPVRVLAAPRRTDKPGVEALADTLETAGDVLDGLPGYAPLEG